MQSKIFNRVLFIAPFFYNYEIKILSELKELGYLVDNVFYSFNDIVECNTKSNLNLRKYHNEVQSLIALNEYSYLFVIKGNILTSNHLTEFKTRNRNSDRILYNWDSIKNARLNENIFYHFDKIYSFDLQDVSKYKRFKIIHKPLFYFNEFNLKLNHKLLYDIGMISMFSNDRYKLVEKIKNLYPNIKYKIYLFTGLTNLKGKLKFFFYKLKNPKINFISQPFSVSQVIKILESTNVVLDFPHKLQSGLTIRTFEALALKKKMITTNNTIRKYDFFKPENIFVIEDDNLNGLKDFLSLKYIELDSKILEKYSLKSWLESFFKSKNIIYLKEKKVKFK